MKNVKGGGGEKGEYKDSVKRGQRRWGGGRKSKRCERKISGRRRVGSLM